MRRKLIKNGRLIDPASGRDGAFDILIEGEKIEAIGARSSIGEVADALIIDASDLWVAPGLIDAHAHLREPGYEYKETFKTGSASAAAGGFTSVVAMANTRPVNDTGEMTRYILEKGRADGIVNIETVGAITKGLEGKELAEIGEMVENGVVAFSDDGRSIQDSGLFRRALEYISIFGLPVMEHAEDYSLNRGGSMNEGRISARLGLVGYPKIAEEAMIQRAALLAEELDAPIHISHISTRRGVEIVRAGKARSAPITAEAAPHHFTLTEEALIDYNSNAKMSPPLRERDDLEAIKEGLADGAIDLIATDHAPHSQSEKELEFDLAPFGIVGFESALPLSLALVAEGRLSALELIRLMSLNPARLLRQDSFRGSIRPGRIADLTIIDPNVEWTIEISKFKSLSKNSPFDQFKVKGRAAMTIVAGSIVHSLIEGVKPE